jgi:hypothetical protein
MLRVQRDKPQETSIPDSDGANPLTQTEGVHLGAAANFQMLDRFPAKTGMSVQAVPVEFAQTSKRAEDYRSVFSPLKMETGALAQTQDSLLTFRRE